MIECRICRITIAGRTDAVDELPGWAQEHLKRCAACRAHYQAATTVPQLLSVGAKHQRHSPSPFLHGAIMATVRSQANSQRQPANTRLVWALMAGAACLVMAVLAWVSQFSSSPASEKSPPVTIANPGELAVDMTLPSAAQVEQWTRTLDTPLEHETQLVLSDATAAIDTLARNFLPQDLLRSSADNKER
jgi:predicted anti-sigma-YlaC factor YlaD